MSKIEIRSWKHTLLTALSVVLVVSSFLLYILVPIFIRSQIAKTLPILNNSISRTYPNWQHIPFTIYNRLYLFNITNVNELENDASGLVVPVVEQLGPYTYQEIRNKENITWESGHTSSDDETIVYQQKRTWRFVPELSNGNLSDEIFHLNMPLISAINVIKRDGGNRAYYYGLNKFLNFEKISLYPKHTAKELLFEGYSDILLDTAKILHIKMPYEKFGWFYGKNNTATDGKFRVYSGTAALEHIGQLYSWNGEQNLDLWGSEACNWVDGTSYSGDVFPPFETSTPKSVNMFVGEICRPLKLTYTGENVVYGVSTNRYSIQSSTFDYSLQENQCYCYTANSCPPKGIANTSVCQDGAPVGISLPHFMYGEQSLFDNIKGLSPNPENHSFSLSIEPILGIPAQISVRIQINALLEPNSKIDLVKKVKSTYYPMLWFDVSAQMSEDSASQIRLLQNLPTYINIIAIALLVIGAVSLLINVKFCKRLRVPTDPPYSHFDTPTATPTD